VIGAKRIVLWRRSLGRQPVIVRQPIDPLAHIIFGATHEAAMLIAHATDEASARNDASAVITRLLEGSPGVITRGQDFHRQYARKPPPEEGKYHG